MHEIAYRSSLNVLYEVCLACLPCMCVESYCREGLAKFGIRAMFWFGDLLLVIQVMIKICRKVPPKLLHLKTKI